MTTFHTILISLVEGITEFLPISSTGHMILVSHWLGVESEVAKSFEIFIQLGAILSIVFLYWERFSGFLHLKKNQGFSGRQGIFLLGLTTFPALVCGFLLHGLIKKYLFGAMPVALALGLGGLFILIGEKKLKTVTTRELDDITPKQALGIGLFQCLALWPGVSRAASTILGGMFLGVERRTAAQYSFFAAVPIMVAAVGYDLLKSISLLNRNDLPLFALGFVVAFLSASLAVKTFIRFLSRYTLNPFAWYRIVLAGIVLISFL